MDVMERDRFKLIIDEITAMPWQALDAEELVQVAWAYYYFSIQFRENLEAALALYPHDEKLAHLASEECETSNLSPWPGVATPGERMNHDEFMRRALALTPLDPARQAHLEQLGQEYLARVRAVDRETQALSIASYEDGGLERTFEAFLRAPHWDRPVLQAFRHFLTEHIRFDSDADAGHGALSRHLVPDDRILPLWTAFRDILVQAAPRLE